MPTNDRSVSAGRDMVGNVVTSGDGNTVTANVAVQMTLPDPKSVNILSALSEIRMQLEKMSGENANKVRRALDDATEEANKSNPDKDQIGESVNRAIDLVKKGGALAEDLAQLLPHIKGIASWLGAKWHNLISAIL
jgi:hypothetical protein